MAQIRDGTLTVANGSSTFVASAGVDWSHVLPGFILIVPGNPTWFEVQSCTLVGGFWTILASAGWAGSSAAGQAYVIVTSFSPNLSIPYPEQGDVQTVSIIKRAILMIDSILPSLTGSGSGSVVLFQTQDGKDLQTQDGESLGTQ